MFVNKNGYICSYNKLIEELIIKGLTYEDVADVINVNINVALSKIVAENEFTLEEKVQIKDAFFNDKKVDELFALTVDGFGYKIDDAEIYKNNSKWTVI